MPSSEDGPRVDLVWYAAYGSNLDPARFDCYLRGGRPPGATRDYPGTRDRSPALEVRAAELPGRLFFAWDSPTWGGGIAFYDPDGDGAVLATAYLLTRRQFADVVEQEMWREPGAEHDLTEVLTHGRHQLGPGRYETLHLVGDLDGHPVLTFSCADPAGLEPNSPAPAYVRTMARGLRVVHGLDAAAITDHVLACPGVTPHWDRESLLSLGLGR